MNKVNPLIFKDRFNLEILPAEPLIGFKMINCQVLCEDDIYRQVDGIEIGFIFFTISYSNMQNNN